MKNLMAKMRNFFKEEDGVTAIEYGLIAALVAILIIAALQVLGPKLAGVFQSVADALPDAPAAG